MCIDDKYAGDSPIEHRGICGAVMNWKSCSARKKMEEDKNRLENEW